MLLRILFAEDLRLRIRYVFLDIQLRGFIKPFEVLHQSIVSIRVIDLTGVLQQTVKTPVVLYAGSESLGTTIQEDHPDVVCFTPLYSTTGPEIALRHPNRTALSCQWPKLSQVIVQLSMQSIQS